MENNKDTKPKYIILYEEAGKAVVEGYKIGINTIDKKLKNAVAEMAKDIQREHSMESGKMDIKNIKIEEVQPYEKNTKKHDKTQINNVAESIKQYGFVQPLVIDKDNVVVIGHCRLLAAKQLGMEEVPCVCVDDLTEEQVRALRIVDNKSNESPWE